MSTLNKPAILMFILASSNKFSACEYTKHHCNEHKSLTSHRTLAALRSDQNTKERERVNELTIWYHVISPQWLRPNCSWSFWSQIRIHS